MSLFRLAAFVFVAALSTLGFLYLTQRHAPNPGPPDPILHPAKLAKPTACEVVMDSPRIRWCDNGEAYILQRHRWRDIGPITQPKGVPAA